MSASIEQLDVLIVGAGLSGIAAAAHLQRDCPDQRYAILEARDAIGGTWDLFRYPGIRSDSDMYTLGYSFRPWHSDQVIADGPAIREYVTDTAQALGISPRIRFGHTVTAASFDSRRGRWRVTVRQGDSPERQIDCRFLQLCTGYYDYDQGYSPEFPGRAEFSGTWVHPQHWPEDLDCAGKQMVVIGSGATAVTLGPSLAALGAKVTLLQRSPSYVLSLPSRDGLASLLRRWLPAGLAHRLTRYKNVSLATLMYQLSKRFPNFMRRLLRKGVRAQLGPGFDLDPHFSPNYAPWDQRLCMVPDGDLFRAMRRGQLQIETDQIDRITERGIQLASGNTLAADVIVSATGLNLKLLGGMQLQVDGRVIDPAQCASYRGMMLSGVPNLVFAVGYTNASWTLKCELTARYACRLIRHLQRSGQAICVAQEPTGGFPEQPLIDLNSGYVQRSAHLLPRQGLRAPWRLYQNYWLDWITLRLLPLRDRHLQFLPAGQPITPTGPLATDEA